MYPSVKNRVHIRVVSEVPLSGPSSWSVSSIPSNRNGEEGTLPSYPPLLSWVHPEWRRRFPWLVQGTTGRSPREGQGDFRLFFEGGSAAEDGIWWQLAFSLGFSGVVHARQVHGKRVLLHGIPRDGLVLGPDADGHVSSAPGVLAAVTVADCVPVFLVDPRGRGIGLLHAGWRGAAAGILEEGLAGIMDQTGAGLEDVLMHLGPGICRICYEVGVEVHQALGLPVPEGPAPLDLRGVLANRAVAQGVLPSNITRSSFCTRCGGAPFFSHRAGDLQRQVGYLGILDR